METLKKVKELLRNSNELKNHKRIYEDRTSYHSCDKKRRDFNGDIRFSVFSVSAVLCCHTGSYGSSSCSTLGRVDNKIAQEAFTNYLNEHMDSIVNWMAADIENKAASLSEQAEAEINEQLKMLKEIKLNTQELHK